MDSINIKTRIFQGNNSLQALQRFKDKKIWIVCDKFLVENKSIINLLKEIDNSNTVKIFHEVVPDPPLKIVGKGVWQISDYKPDIIIGFGGGSAIDTAKAAIYFARERKIIEKVLLIAIPTTSGTGSEVTAATVITDKEKKIKHLIFDERILPDEAILEGGFTTSVPKEITANTGLDVIAHALEAYVGKGANDYSDALAEKAIEIVINSLLKCYLKGDDIEVRNDMMRASNIAGMAFNIAGLGIVHGIAHQLGGKFHIPHGLANSIVLNEAIEFNSKDKAILSKYAKITYKTGMVKWREDETFALAVLKNWISSIKKLMNMDMTLSDFGIDREWFNKEKESLAENALEDYCTLNNSRKISKKEIEIILENIY